MAAHLLASQLMEAKRYNHSINPKAEIILATPTHIIYTHSTPTQGVGVAPISTFELQPTVTAYQSLTALVHKRFWDIA